MDVTLYFLFGLLGVLTHFLKRKVRGQTAASIRRYFLSHFKDTIVTILMYVAIFAYLVKSGELDYFTAFASGYMCDSIFNKTLDKP